MYLKTLTYKTHILKYDKASLEDKYIMTVLISYLRECKNNKRYITTDDFYKLFHTLGYKSLYQKKLLNNMLCNFVKNKMFVQYADKVGIKLNPMKVYTDINAINNKVCYIDLHTKQSFMLKHFKKQAVILLYAEPQAINKKSKKYDHISFTTQNKIAKTLGLQQKDVSVIAKDYNKLYVHECVYTTKNKQQAYDYIKHAEKIGKYTIVEDNGLLQLTWKNEFDIWYHVYLIRGSKLFLKDQETVIWFKYKEKCKKKISRVNYQILDDFCLNSKELNCAPHKKSIEDFSKKSFRVSTARTNKNNTIDCFYYTNDFKHKTIVYKDKKEATILHKIKKNKFLINIEKKLAENIKINNFINSINPIKI